MVLQDFPRPCFLRINFYSDGELITHLSGYWEGVDRVGIIRLHDEKGLFIEKKCSIVLSQSEKPAYMLLPKF
jgi:hypothetical protein